MLYENWEVYQASIFGKKNLIKKGLCMLAYFKKQNFDKACKANTFINLYTWSWKSWCLISCLEAKIQDKALKFSFSHYFKWAFAFMDYSNASYIGSNREYVRLYVARSRISKLEKIMVCMNRARDSFRTVFIVFRLNSKRRIVCRKNSTLPSYRSSLSRKCWRML